MHRIYAAAIRAVSRDVNCHEKLFSWNIHVKFPGDFQPFMRRWKVKFESIAELFIKTKQKTFHEKFSPNLKLFRKTFHQFNKNKLEKREVEKLLWNFMQKVKSWRHEIYGEISWNFIWHVFYGFNPSCNNTKYILCSPNCSQRKKKKKKSRDTALAAIFLPWYIIVFWILTETSVANCYILIVTPVQIN